MVGNDVRFPKIVSCRRPVNFGEEDMYESFNQLTPSLHVVALLEATSPTCLFKDG